MTTSDRPYEIDNDPKIDSRDSDGHFCGQSNVTGEYVRSDLTWCGYCGPHCPHCVDSPMYALQDGVWVCAADYEYED